METVIGWLTTQMSRNVRVIKYAIVGFTGVAVNLLTLALLVKATSQKTWVASGVATVISTLTNFVLHNLWTFADRRHKGVGGIVRGFLSYGFTAVLGIGITTGAFAGLLKVAAHLPFVSSHSRNLILVLGCQFVAVMLGALSCYILNVKYTWSEPKSQAPAVLEAESVSR